MRFKFKIQDFQTDACDSVVRVFSGQPKQNGLVYRHDVGHLSGQIDLEQIGDKYFTGYRNAEIALSGNQLLKNIQEVQRRNNINTSSKIEPGLGAVSLDIEMETGTGKTYVYIKTMFELYRIYGWCKFIVVVPSIAIREGVKKSFEMTQDHFMEQYGIKARFFVYSSSNLHQLDEFSQNSGINVMIINTQAFNTTLNEKKSVEGRGGNQYARIIYSKRDEFGSRRPIDVIRANRPIIILDEPQKMGGKATQNALKNNFNPLFSLNYSATHKTSHNLIYVLDALDAFKKKLVKKIEVKGFELKNLHGVNSYLYLSEISITKNKPPRAKIEFEIRRAGGISRQARYFVEGDDLYIASNKLESYRGVYITEIDPTHSTVRFSTGEILKPNEASGSVSDLDIRRIQIRETIESHFDKEEKLFDQGIKCLSLFFIDEVAKYRQYDELGEEILGEYGKIFEEEYKGILCERSSRYSFLYSSYLQGIEVADTHTGYFSIDKKGRAVNSTVKRGQDFSDDISAYDLILKNKERLLSFEEPTRFIFSHSALREGWDNPNVFQICTLKHSDSTTTRRQEVGRGLRLCVNKEGERQDVEVCGEGIVHNINKLTVVASESYADFVSKLQSEIEADLYERPEKASITYFEGKYLKTEDGGYTVSDGDAQAIYNYLVRNDYVDDSGYITEEYHRAASVGNLAPMKKELQPYANRVHDLIQSIDDPRLREELISNAGEAKVENTINENWDDFVDLWERINKKYAYTVQFDSEELIEKSVQVINERLTVGRLSYVRTVGEQVTEGDVDIAFTTRGSRTQQLERAAGSKAKYDLIGKIAERTTLTRKTVSLILKRIKPEKMQYFVWNPEEFIRRVAGMINQQKASVVVDHIQYIPSAEEPYTQDIFNLGRDSEAYKRAFRANKSIQDFVFIDGVSEKSVERRFVEELDVAEEVVVYAKLPSGPKGFSIPTPVGNYSPDWAITFKKDQVKHIFFIAETKGSMISTTFSSMIRLDEIEKAKIACAKKLFNEISTSEVKYHEVASYDDLRNILEAL